MARRLGLLANLFILASFGLWAAIPALDHHAAEYNPWHGHLVLGADRPQEQAEALAVHEHGFGQPHKHYPVTGWLPQAAGHQDHTAPQVLVTASVVEGLVSFLIASEDILPRPIELPPVTPAGGLWQQLRPDPFFSLGFDTPPPKPPPRSHAG